MVHPGDFASMSDKDRSSSTGRAERPKKKVEWSTNLTEQSFAPEDRSPNWDSETDHLLSYFLGGEQQNGGVASPATQFATTHAPSTSGNPVGILQNKKESISSNFAFLNDPHRGQVMQNHHASFPGQEDDDDQIPPPTPATQYYHYASKPKAVSSKPPMHDSAPRHQPSSAVMKHSIAAMNGRPRSSSEHSMDSMSPISPAALIGSGHEELMLPPSPNTAQVNHSSSGNTQQQARQSHLEWLQHINALAKQANSASSNNTIPAPAAPQMQMPHQPIQAPQPSQMPHPVVMGYPGVPGLPVAAYGHAPMYYAHAALQQIQQQQSPPVESEEKRAKRLERNRESARKSRRRKKERLSHLEEKVSGLHNQIEAARTIQINDMNSQLQDFFLQRITHLESADHSNDAAVRETLAGIFKGAGHNSEVQRAVIDFQYSKLKQTLLPRYQKFLLWLTLHEENWFTDGKDEHTKREAKRQTAKVNSGKISSKQVGDELTNGSKLEDGTFIPPPQPGKANANGDKANQTALAFDNLRMWPLLCFELSISVDQEERMIHAHKSAQRRQDIQHVRTQMEAAARMASRLKEAVLLQSHNVAARSDRTYLDILTPQQTVAYQKWLTNNRGRCEETVKNRRTQQDSPVPDESMDSSSTTSENMTLIEVCRKLEAVLKISKVELEAK
mmetsp:Transcript_18694/g.54032  ORF Transcript_18694/g.54032 Transcript_18694/m.54032 type:complete len:672 (-) Transcript_18694:22-2037(-)